MAARSSNSRGGTPRRGKDTDRSGKRTDVDGSSRGRKSVRSAKNPKNAKNAKATKAPKTSEDRQRGDGQRRASRSSRG